MKGGLLRVGIGLYSWIHDFHDWPMTSSKEKLTIELEDVGSTSWWARILTTLTSQYGSTLQRFVGRVDGKALYTSGTFSSARPASPMSPREDWAPDLTTALNEIQQDLANDGWIQVGRGADPWSLTYEREKRETPG